MALSMVAFCLSIFMYAVWLGKSRSRGNSGIRQDKPIAKIQTSPLHRLKIEDILEFLSSLSVSNTSRRRTAEKRHFTHACLSTLWLMTTTNTEARIWFVEPRRCESIVQSRFICRGWKHVQTAHSGQSAFHPSLPIDIVIDEHHQHIRTTLICWTRSLWGDCSNPKAWFGCRRECVSV